ncbi:MAG: SGNH/GDSL hydrolase family protein [Planctomycetota bacterium]
MRKLRLALLLASFSVSLTAQEEKPSMNLLLNPSFEFHTFLNHREGKAESFRSHNVAFWNTDAWGDVTVTRESHVDATIRPPFTTRNMVSIAPGKRMWQFFTLPEAGLGHGDRVSLMAYGNQSKPGALRASVKLMKLDSEDGTWTPADFGYADKRTFPKHSRGELVVARSYDAASDKTGPVELKVENAEIIGRFTDGEASHSSDINTIGLQVEFQNAGAEGDVWVYSPCLCKGPKALAGLPPAREMVPWYRYIPRTIQKLWKGETIHIIVMGSSIDRGSANPPMYLYDEDPNSPTFKQPISERTFEPEKVNRPDLDGYVGWWQHYWDYAGRLRLELMRKFNLPVSKICLNFMACDGSCVGEAHSGLTEYCSLALPPSENDNGHKAGTKWQQLYPDLFARPDGPRPDLVIFGSGANEKTDTPDEVAVFEGMIRWIQRHYPNTEFIFCQFQNCGGYTPNPGDLQALSLRYQIPVLDYGKVGDDATRWCNRYALVPRDGHPQAASHYLWFKQLEKAFECWDPILPSQAQLQLPERVHPNAYGWEGEMTTYDAKSPRIKGAKFIFDDTAINCWGGADKEVEPTPYVDGEKLHARRSLPGRNVRNSLFRHGRCRLGDRHILELEGKDAKLTAVDAKVCPDRQFFGMDNPRWRLNGASVADFQSEWGAPYGAKQVALRPGSAVEIDVVCTDVSVAYVDAPKGGTLKATIDGVERLVQPTSVPFVDIEKKENFMENRKGILGLGYGLHTVRIEAADGPVTILGVFTYDSRSNRAFERRIVGRAAAGETVAFSLPFKARPVVICHGGLEAETKDISPEKVGFSGEGIGAYEIIGE